MMIVDDSRISCAIISDLLSKTRFEVVATARTAAEAVKMFKRYRPEVVTMDMNMPDANGLECTKLLRKIDNNVRVVMISSMCDDSLIEQGKTVGILDFVQKPVRIDELLEALVNLCSRKLVNMNDFIEDYVTEFNHSLSETLARFTGQECVQYAEKAQKDSLLLEGISVLMGLTGETRGRVVIHMDQKTMYKFTAAFLNKDENQLDDETAMETLQEAVNIIVGRAVSAINDHNKEKEMRTTPPGLIVGSNVKLAGTGLKAFRTKCVSAFGTMYMELGFAEEN